MKQDLHVGIVGCGGIAKAHLAAYRENGAKVAWVYDPVREAAESFSELAGARIAACPETMAKKDKLDAVSICSPPVAHLDNCRPFLDAGVPVLCEKPLALDGAQARTLTGLAEAAKTVFMTAFCHRFHPPIVELKRMIDDGVLGRPLLFRNLFGGYVALQGNHRTDPGISGGGCLIDHCAHSVDLFRFLVGEPDAVQAVGGKIMQDHAIEDFGMIHLSMADRAYGEITASYSLPVCANVVEVYGTDGTAVVSYFSADHPDLVWKLRDDSSWHSRSFEGQPSRFTAEVEHFLACVQNRSTPRVTARDGLRSSFISDAIYKSVRDGCRVSLS